LYIPKAPCHDTWSVGCYTTILMTGFVFMFLCRSWSPTHVLGSCHNLVAIGICGTCIFHVNMMLRMLCRSIYSANYVFVHIVRQWEIFLITFLFFVTKCLIVLQQVFWTAWSMLQKNFFFHRNTICSWLSKWLQTELCVPDLQHMTDPNIVSTITKQSEYEEEEGNSVHINHTVRHFAIVCWSMELSI
jgi:hypothetical protein